MRPIFDMKIIKDKTTLLHIDNIETPLDFLIKTTRSINYQVSVNEFCLANFIDPFLNEEVMLHRSYEENQTIEIKAGYQIGYHSYLYSFTVGKVAYYKGNYDNNNSLFNISFVENTIDGALFYDSLNSAFIKEPLKKITWRSALLKIFGDTVDKESLKLINATTIVNIPGCSYYNFLMELSNKTDTLWYFKNNMLYFADLMNPVGWFDLTNPYSIKTPAVLVETNPFMILKNLNPLEKLNRVWAVETVFNPNIIPGVGVVAVDKYYHKKKGFVSKVEYVVNNDKASNIITFVEVVKK